MFSDSMHYVGSRIEGFRVFGLGTSEFQKPIFGLGYQGLLD